MSIAYSTESLPESEFEAAAFYEQVADAARGGRAYRPLALLAMKAARAALVEGGKGGEGDPELELELEGSHEWETTPAAVHQSYAPHDRESLDKLMEHLGHAAAEAESNGEAFAFLAPLVPLAMKAALPLAKMAAKKLLPKAATMVAKVAPKLIKGVNAVAKTLRANPAGRQLVRALPRVVQQTTRDLANRVAGGANVDGQQAVQALARQTARVIGNPQALVETVRQSAAADRGFHLACRSVQPACGCRGN